MGLLIMVGVALGIYIFIDALRDLTSLIGTQPPSTVLNRLNQLSRLCST